MTGARTIGFRIAAVAAFLSAAAVAHGDLSIERGDDGVSWICGEGGGRIVGIGSVRLKQKDWRGDVVVTQGVDSVVASIEVRGDGEEPPRTCTLLMPHGEGATKGQFPVKPGRWRRHEAGHEAEPVEKSLGKWKVVRSPHGNLIFTLVGREAWSGNGYESVNLEERGAGLFARDIVFREMREGETPEECCARAHGLPFSLALSCPARNHIFDGGDAALDFTITETAGHRAEAVSVSLVVRDWDGREIFARKRNISIRPHGRISSRATVPAPGRGIFFAELAVGEGEAEEFTRTTFAVIPPFRFSWDDSFFFGVAARMGNTFAAEAEAEYALAARLGMRYVRSGDNALAARFGMRAGFTRPMPKHDYDPANPEDAATITEWLDEIDAMGSPIFEFGNEIGHFEDEATRHILYDRYNGWLDAIRAARQRRGMSFKIAYGTSARRPELMRLIEGKGIFGKLDIFVVHPGRLNWTPDAVGPGWRYRGLILGSKRIYADMGHAATPIILTEVYAKTQPNAPLGDSLRQSAESAVLNAVIAKADGMAGFCAFQLHEGTSFDENGIAPGNGKTRDVEWHYGILNRDNSLKPSAIAYETAAEELDGARFVREVRLAGTELRGFLFDTPRGPLAVLWDRTEGFDLRTQGPRRRAGREKFFHFEPWLDNWRVRVPYAFRAVPGVTRVEVRDAIGRLSEVDVEGGTASLTLTGAPLFVRGLAPDQFVTAPEPDLTGIVGVKSSGEFDDIY